MKIEEYSFGKIKIDGKSYERDVIIFPEYIRTNWWRKEGHKLHIEDIEDVIRYKPDFLVIGTGAHGMMKVDDSVLNELRRVGIKTLVLPTEEACRKFNELMKKGVKVVAALHLTC